jgi:DNA-binding GntR family transcriptional regulator
MASDDQSSVEGVAHQLVAGPSLSDQAYRAVRRMIINGQLHRGQRVTERALAERLGVSATPVREAFLRLEHERLIERRDGRAATIADPSDAYLASLNLIQAALRGVAARIAATEATWEDVARIRDAHQEALKLKSVRPVPTPALRVEVTGRFHECIYRAARNELLIDFIATSTAFDLADQLRVAEQLQGRYPPQSTLDEHEAILAAIEEHDGDRAEELMRAHIFRDFDLFRSEPADAERSGKPPAPRRR